MPNLQINDVSIDTKNAKVALDGTEVDPSLLAVGMVVSASGLANPDGSLKADTNEVEGIVLTNQNTQLDIMGQTVYVNDKTVFESYDSADSSIADIDVGNIVEVSGHSAGEGAAFQ